MAVTGGWALSQGTRVLAVIFCLLLMTTLMQTYLHAAYATNHGATDAIICRSDADVVLVTYGTDV